MAHDPYLEHLFAALNFLLCMAIGWICVCRLRLTSDETLMGPRLKYSLYGAAALVHGLSPMAGEWPGWTGLALTGSLLIGLLTSWSRWRHAVPDELQSSPAPLGKE